MTSRLVFIFHTDGSFSRREYPSAESASTFAKLACEQFPSSGVQLGDQVVQAMGPTRE